MVIQPSLQVSARVLKHRAHARETRFLRSCCQGQSEDYTSIRTD